MNPIPIYLSGCCPNFYRKMFDAVQSTGPTINSIGEDSVFGTQKELIDALMITLPFRAEKGVYKDHI